MNRKRVLIMLNVMVLIVLAASVGPGGPGRAGRSDEEAGLEQFRSMSWP